MGQHDDPVAGRIKALVAKRDRALRHDDLCLADQYSEIIIRLQAWLLQDINEVVHAIERRKSGEVVDPGGALQTHINVARLQTRLKQLVGQ